MPTLNGIRVRENKKKWIQREKKKCARFCYQHFLLFNIKRETFIAAILSNHLSCALAWLQVASLKQCSMLKRSYNVPVPDTNGRIFFLPFFMCIHETQYMWITQMPIKPYYCTSQQYTQGIFFQWFFFSLKLSILNTSNEWRKFFFSVKKIIK